MKCINITIIDNHEKVLKALILLSIKSPILFSSWSQIFFCFSIAIILSNLWMQHRYTHLLTSSGFLLEITEINESVNSSLFISTSYACPWSKFLSFKKSCSFLLCPKIVFIISFTSYSLFALEVVGIDFTVTD